jgi:hypothetical protein
MKCTLLHFTTLSIAVALLAFCSLAAAEMYEYVDENGAISFTDDPGRIPKSRQKSSKMRPKAQENESMTETHFQLLNNHIVVPVTVSYRGRDIRGKFVFDTGAAGSMISPGIAKQLNINPRDADVAVIEGVGGFRLAGTVVLDFISIGPQRAGSVEVAVSSFGDYDGLLGNDVLGSSRFQVDYSARRIRWQ